MLKKSGLVAVVMAVVFGVSAFSLEKIVFRLNWIPGGDHVFYFVAKELGFYTELGLDVEIQRGRGSGDTVSAVDVGIADIGLADAGVIAVARSRGARVKIFAVIYARSPNGIKTIAETGIRTPHDLIGKSVGVPAGDAQRVLWPALAKANGIDPAAVILVDIAPGAKPSALAARRVDAVFDWIPGNVEYWAVGLGPDKLVVIPWAEWGVNPYGNSLFTTERLITERPDIVQRFLEGTLRAWQWSIANLDKAIEIFVKYNPEVPPIAAKTRFVDDITRLVDSPEVRSIGLGWFSMERMKETVDLVNLYFDVPRPITVDEVCSLEFLMSIPKFALPELSHLPTVEQLWQEWRSTQR